MNTGEKLGEILDWSRLNQKQLSQLTGISTSTISGYVTGGRKMTVDAAQKIAAALDVSVWALLNGEPMPVTPLDLTGAEREMVAEYRQLTGRERELVDLTLRTLNSRKHD